MWQTPIFTSRFQALPTLERSAESPEAAGAVGKVPFSPVDLEAGQATPEPIDEVRVQSLRVKALSKVHVRNDSYS